MNVESPEIWTVAQVEKKWFDIKADTKKQQQARRKRKKQGGQGHPNLSDQDEKLPEIMG